MRHSGGLPGYVSRVDLETIWRESDAISLHCPLTEATHGLVSAARLARMKPDAVLINTAIAVGPHLGYRGLLSVRTLPSPRDRPRTSTPLSNASRMLIATPASTIN